jgi:hypothetical protein
LGVEAGTYEAYCLDEAVIYFGMRVETMLESAGHKPSKEERRAKAAREALINKLFSNETDKKSGFADPAAMFN